MKTSLLSLLVSSLLVMALTSKVSAAEVVHCDNVYIDHMAVEGDRDDNFEFNNKLIIQLKNASGSLVQCGGKQYIYLDINSKSFDGLLQIALSAHNAHREILVGVNKNHSLQRANQLSFIQMKYK